MSVSSNSIRHYEQTLLHQAEILILALVGFRSVNAERAAQLLSEISERFASLGRDAPSPVSGAPSDRFGPVLVSSRSAGGDAIEEFVLDILGDSPRGLSVQEIVERLKEAELAIKRETLVVRLHRMEYAGKLASLAHGHYALSEAERERRRL